MPRDFDDEERDLIEESRRRRARINADPGLRTVQELYAALDRCYDAVVEYLKEHERPGGCECAICEEADVVHECLALRFLAAHTANFLQGNVGGSLRLDDDDQDDDGPDDEPVPEPDDPQLVGCV